MNRQKNKETRRQGEGKHVGAQFIAPNTGLLAPPNTNAAPNPQSTIHNTLIFVEDPGAANYVASLPPLLTAKGMVSRLFTAGSATEYLNQRHIPNESLPNEFLLPQSPTPNAQHSTPNTQYLPPSSLLLVGASENPDTVGLRLIEECRRVGGCSVGLVDAVANAAYRFRGRTHNPLAHAPDWLIVPDAATQQAFVALDYAPQRIVVCGHPHYDTARAEGERLALIGRETLRSQWLPGIQPGQRAIVFVAEISTGMEPTQFQRSPEYTLHGWGQRHGRTEIVLEEFLDAVHAFAPDAYLVLRLHPKNTREEFAPYLDAFTLVSNGGVPLELLAAADMIVGMSSMLLLEAALLRQPTLSILPRACEQAWLPTTRTGVTPCATTRAALHAILPQILLQSAVPNTDIDSVIPRGSSERVVAFLTERLAACNRPSTIAHRQ